MNVPVVYTVKTLDVPEEIKVALLHCLIPFLFKFFRAA